MKERSPKYWMISDRDNGGTGTGLNNEGLTYWISENGPLADIENWQSITSERFKEFLVNSANRFPMIDPAKNEQQSHVTILIHGYNESFSDAVSFYEKICGKLFNGDESLGICVLYDWPSIGNVLGYEPDRSHARQCAEDLTNILCELFDWLILKQREAINNPANACKAKVSIIAHSMGNYVLQKAMAAAWTRKNQPLLVSLVNQLVMVAADVDNDLFDAGAPDNDDGSAIANLTYRITSLFSGRDAVLGASAGLKHFGTRRLGRSGLASRPPLNINLPRTDNVWDIDCSSFFPNNIGSMDIHGAYFDNDTVIDLMRKLLRGIDRNILSILGHTKSNAWPQ